MPAPEVDAPATEARPVAAEVRLRELVRDHLQFTWRLLRRLGLPAELVDDAVQRVFIVASAKLGDIAPGSERAFLFRTAMHVASTEKRSFARRREVLLAEPETIDAAPGADEQLDQHRGRVVLDSILEEMDISLRVVFVLFELEDMSTAEIALALDLPMGTVSSRLRRAREDFQGSAKRHRARMRGGIGGGT